MQKSQTDHSDEYAYRTYIKDIYLELPNYKHHHSSLNGGEDEIFIGRGENSKKIEDTLNSSEKNGNGSYLVTGYRGMGKTSLVNNVLKSYKDKKLKEGILIRRINVNFSQTNLNESDILKQLVQNIIYDIERNPFIKFSSILSLTNISIVAAYLLTTYYVLNNEKFVLITFLGNIFKDLKSENIIALLFTISYISFTVFILKKAFLQIAKLINTLYPWSNGYINYSFNIIRSKFLRSPILILSISLICLFLFPLLFALSELVSIYHFGTDLDPFINSLILYILIVFTLSIRVKLLVKYIFELIIGEKKIYDKLIDILERCNTTVTSETGLQNAGESFLLGFINKKSKSYPIANSKEIENEIIFILKKYNKFNLYQKKYVIVFDELDKIETTIGKASNFYDEKQIVENTDITQKELIELGIRKKIILNILSSLKYFTTEAKARFIFIAGREMFDAALADIADRQSSLSSIFHQIIYLDSFLKDKGSLGQDRGLTNLVEEYLQEIMLPIEFKKDKQLKVYGKDINLKTSSTFIKKYYNYLASKDNSVIEENLKIIYTLQNFIIYLTYRSNGSPKKLVKLVEEYIESKNLMYSGKAINSYKRVYIIENENLNTEKLFVRLSYKSQYKFAFISYLYRPFILNHSQFIKQYSDNVLVSTPYLMDHIIKFHPFAFSLQNLELLPEVISNNKNPILRYFIEELISFLGENHIRETEIGLFEYKFINKTSNEILYLSKVFETESAAFNFTLNETDLVKNYLQKKIKEIIVNNTNINNTEDPYNYSLSFLYNLLGDSYYYDQEFDNSIIAYQSGLQLLRTNTYTNLNYEKFIMLIRFKLKLGLIYEKMKSYDLALAIFNDSITDSINYLLNLESTQGNNKNDINILPLTNGKKYSFNSFNDLIQTINQTLIASIYLVEKMNVEGVTIYDLTRYHHTFLQIVNTSQKYNGPISKIVANYYTNVGNLLYYKNFKIKNVSFRKIKDECTNSSDYNKYSKIKVLVLSTFKEYEPESENVDFLLNVLSQKTYKNVTYKEPILPSEENEVEDWELNKGENSKKFNKDYRFSFYTFLTYKHAFSKLIQSDMRLSFQKKSLLEMFMYCSEINYKYENKYDKIYLKNIALSISNIANQLFIHINTRYKKISVDGVLKDAIQKWCLDLDRISAIQVCIRSSFSSIINHDTTEFFNIKKNLEELEELWYTNDKFKQELINVNKKLKNHTSFNNELHFDDIKSILSDLENKTVKEKVKYGILAFWDKYIFEYFKGYNERDLKSEFKDLDLIILLYYLSGRFYSRAGKSVSFGFQLKKILHIVKNTVDIKPVDNSNPNFQVKLNNDQLVIKENQGKLLTLLEETFLFQILEITSWNSSSTDRPQIYKYKNAQNIDTIYHPPYFARFNYFNTSNASAIKEAIYLFADIKLSSKDFSNFNSLEECVKYVPEIALMSPYNIVYTQYSRILELDLQEKINRSILKSFLFAKIFNSEIIDIFSSKENFKIQGNPASISLWEGTLFGPYKRYGVSINPLCEENLQHVTKRFVIEGKDCGDLEKTIELALWAIVDKIYSNDAEYVKSFLDYQQIIANSIYSLRQIISAIRIQEVNYYISYSYLALFHYKLGIWYKHFALCRSILRRLKEFYSLDYVNKIDGYLESLLGSDGIISLDSTSQFQIALQYYHKAKQIHSNGLEYERILKNLLFLEDDFNDNLYHFGISLERQRLNSYHIRRRIKNLENELRDSPLYRYESFTGSVDGTNFDQTT